MDKAKTRRINALRALNSFNNIELSSMCIEQRQANDNLNLLKKKLVKIDDEISQCEQVVRSALDPGADVVIEEYQMLVAYLEQKQQIRINSKRQHGFAETRLEKVNSKVVQHGLKIRGVENILERRLKELQLELDNKEQLVLDEAWLLKGE